MPHKPASADSRALLGRRSEQLAVRFLRAHGYVIEQTNVRFPVGEIDIVARDGHTLCFIEVRSTTSAAWGGPLASIGGRKVRRLIRAARWYLSRYLSRGRVLSPETRFDVVSIVWTNDGPPVPELVRGAFEAD